MSKVIELRLTKSQYEKVLIGALLADFMKNGNQEIGERDAQLLRTLMLVAEINKLDDLVTREEGEITATEKVIKKVEKALDNYTYAVLEEHREIMKRAKK